MFGTFSNWNVFYVHISMGRKGDESNCAENCFNKIERSTLTKFQLVHSLLTAFQGQVQL